MSETLIFSENNKLPPTKKKIFIGRWLLKNKKKKIQNCCNRFWDKEKHT